MTSPRVRLTGGLLAERQRTVIERTLPAIYAKLEESGRLDNFRRAAAHETGGFQGTYYDDSDVYKYLEACAYASTRGATEQVREQTESVLRLIVVAQEPDGYLNTFFQLQAPHLKWRNLGGMHEGYCGGHLIEAAVALRDELGDDRLLNVALRWVEAWTVGCGPDRFDGHPGLELALCRLADKTGEGRYREMARAQIDAHGARPSPLEAEFEDAEAQSLARGFRHLMYKDDEYDGGYALDHVPLDEATEIEGHAVRAAYLYTGAAVAIPSPKRLSALAGIFERLVARRIYVTGGIGPSARNEGFTGDYDLPNRTAYAETCASAALIFWTDAMTKATGESAYGDVMERTLFNALLSGISEDGTEFFYTNPLESDASHRRQTWFTCACCPPNVARLLTGVERFLVQTEEDRVTVVVPFTGDVESPMGRWRFEANYPYGGAFAAIFEGPEPARGTLAVRIPDWADELSVDLPDEAGADYDRGYAVCEREWRPGDRAAFEFETPVRMLGADPRVRDCLGRVAVARGPLVFMCEDTPFSFTVDPGEEPRVTFRADGEPEIEVSGWEEDLNPTDELYVSLDDLPDAREATRTLRPYHRWANAESSEMQVWIRRI